MCLTFPRRRGNRPTLMPGLDESQIGLSAMNKMVCTTTLISPTYDSEHFDRRMNNISISAPRQPVGPSFSLGDNILNQLEGIFRTLCGRSNTTFSHTFHNRRLSIPGVPKPYLTREKMSMFLEHTQGEVLAGALDKDRYYFHEFLQVWQRTYGCNASRPPAFEEIMDMSLPISHYFISSSHNTYLSGNQLSSTAEVSIYQKVLKDNCRCIEIDVWNPQNKAKSKKNPDAQLPKPNHRRHISGTSVAASLHGSLEAVTNLLASKTLQSRASSFSQRSIHSPAPGEDATAAKQFDPTAMLSRLREENSQILVDEAAIDDAEDCNGEAQAAPLTTSDSETPQTPQTSQTSQETTVPAIAQIQVTAPDTNIPVPAQVHDGAECSDGDEPIVMHAHTFAQKDLFLGTHVPFRDVCRAVKNEAFVTNHMPIIVSLEVHTNAEYQRKMVKIMKEEWGNLLLEAPLDGTDPRLRLPTLGDLQDKILVKVKRAYVPSKPAGGANASAPQHGTGLGLGSSLPIAPPMERGNSSDSENSAPASNGNTPKIRNAGITEELGSLAVYTESRRLENFADRDAKLPSHIFSLSEVKIQELHETNHTELFEHNKKYMMRAYPDATKHVMSTNPDPACCWRRGVQMVALNWQSLDKAMMLNHGMFEGTHGWILKPEGYRFPPAAKANSAVDDSSSSTNTSETAGRAIAPMAASIKPGLGFGVCPVAVAEPTRSLDLHITVYAGQHLPLPPVLENKIKKKYAGKARSIASTAGFVTNRGHAHFHPMVKCELNVEHAEKRCPETVASSRSLVGRSGTTPSSTPKIPSGAFIASSVRTSTSAIAGVGAPSVRVVAPPSKPSETANKHKTSAGKTDHPHWGPGGETLSFPNVSHIVESLSFVTFLIEDDGSKDALGLSDTLAAWACIRLDRLRTGYRFVHLMDRHGRPTDGKLLVKIEKRYRS